MEKQSSRQTSDSSIVLEEFVIVDEESSSHSTTVSQNGSNESSSNRPQEAAPDPKQLEKEPTEATAATLEDRRRSLADKLELLDAQEDSIKQQETLLAKQKESLRQQQAALQQLQTTLWQQEAALQQQRASVAQKKSAIAQEMAAIAQRKLPPNGSAMERNVPLQLPGNVGSVKLLLPPKEQPHSSAAAAVGKVANKGTKRSGGYCSHLGTITFDELQQHMARVDEFWNKAEKTMRCPICNKQGVAHSVSTVLDHLSRHLEEPGDLPYKCPVAHCDFHGLFASHIRQHVLHAHRVPWTLEMELACVDKEKKPRFDALIRQPLRWELSAGAARETP